MIANGEGSVAPLPGALPGRGLARLGEAWHGRARQTAVPSFSVFAGQGEAWRGEAGQGEAWRG
jgi:hypothetical protein